MSQETADIIDALVKAGRHLARRAEVAGLGETTCRHLRTAAREAAVEGRCVPADRSGR